MFMLRAAIYNFLYFIAKFAYDSVIIVRLCSKNNSIDSPLIFDYLILYNLRKFDFAFSNFDILTSLSFLFILFQQNQIACSLLKLCKVFDQFKNVSLIYFTIGVVFIISAHNDAYFIFLCVRIITECGLG